MGGGCEEELVSGAVGSAEAQPVEPEDAFEVGEEHLDLLSSSAGISVGIRCHDVAGHVACCLVDVPGDLARRLVWRASTSVVRRVENLVRRNRSASLKAAGLLIFLEL